MTDKPAVSVTELGCTGHLIVGDSCRWKRHTQVGFAFRVSTVGNYYPPKGSERRPLGASEDSFFETMVFPTEPVMASDAEGCGCYLVESWGGIDGERYTTAGEAQAGHERMVAKYVAIVNGEAE